MVVSMGNYFMEFDYLVMTLIMLVNLRCPRPSWQRRLAENALERMTQTLPDPEWWGKWRQKVHFLMQYKIWKGGWAPHDSAIVGRKGWTPRISYFWQNIIYVGLFIFSTHCPWESRHSDTSRMQNETRQFIFCTCSSLCLHFFLQLPLPHPFQCFPADGLKSLRAQFWLTESHIP